MQFSFSPGRLSRAVFAVIISCSLVACGGGGGKKHGKDDNYHDDDYIEIIGGVIGVFENATTVFVKT